MAHAIYVEDRISKTNAHRRAEKEAKAVASNAMPAGKKVTLPVTVCAAKVAKAAREKAKERAKEIMGKVVSHIPKDGVLKERAKEREAGRTHCTTAGMVLRIGGRTEDRT